MVYPPVLMADYNIILGVTADSLIVSNTAGDDSLALLSGNDTVTGTGGIDISDLVAMTSSLNSATPAASSVALVTTLSTVHRSSVAPR